MSVGADVGTRVPAVHHGSSGGSCPKGSWPTTDFLKSPQGRLCLGLSSRRSSSGLHRSLNPKRRAPPPRELPPSGVSRTRPMLRGLGARSGPSTARMSTFGRPGGSLERRLGCAELGLGCTRLRPAKIARAFATSMQTLSTSTAMPSLMYVPRSDEGSAP